MEPEAMSDGFVDNWMQENEGVIPPGVYGLPPMGKRKVEWRWTGPVFEDSPDDLQKRSIVVRNLQELGVPSLEALNVMFPDKTKREKEGMLAGGYPFRYMNAVAGTTGQMLGLYQQIMQLPSQTDPNVPLIASIPLEPMLRKSAEVLFNELNYAKPIDQSSPGESPYITGANSYDQWLRTVGKLQYGLAAAAGQPVSLPPELGGTGLQQSLSPGTAVPGAVSPNPGYLGSPTGYGAGATGNLTYTGGNTTGIQQSLPGTAGSAGSGTAGQFIPIPPEYVVGLPQPGSTVGTGASKLPKSPTGSELYSQYQQSNPAPAKGKSGKSKSGKSSKPQSTGTTGSGTNATNSTPAN